jgi:RNA polymerase sigma factor (sigma-70 family)
MDQRELVLAAKEDRRRREELIETFYPLVASVARGYVRSGVIDRRELMQQGVVGLLRALARYDPSLGTPFWAYASWWVRKAMQELLAEVTRPVALSDHAMRALSQIRAARRDLLQVRGAEPTNAELAAATGMTEPQLEGFLAVERRAPRFGDRLGADEDAAFGEAIVDLAAEQEYEHVLDRLELEEVRGLVDELDERERMVLSGHFGLGRPAQTLAEIGSVLGLTAERVRQIEANALKKLRTAVAEPPAVRAGS